MWILLLFGSVVNAKEFTKEVKKSTFISPYGLVDLTNTKGTIDVRTWDKKEVRIEVLITVNARNETDADNVFERIRILFNSHGKKVTAKTEIQEMPKWSWNYVRSEYTVDYTVYMPKTCNLNLFNKFGDAFISEISGTATLSVQHGNIRLNTVERQLKLDLKYGNCTVARANNSEINMIHGNIRLKKANDINLYTSYSKVNVDEADFITCRTLNDTYVIGLVKEFNNRGKYDNIKITKANNIVVVSKFSDFNINEIQRSANFEMTNGSVVIKEVAQGFSDVLMIGEQTDFQIEVEKGTNYKMNATSRHANLKFPKTYNVVSKDDQGSEQKVEFYVGKKVNPYSYIKAKVKYGDLSVK
ncbi:MAG: hypothetical protein AAF573_03535 [Bacteroidota bacterium]